MPEGTMTRIQCMRFRLVASMSNFFAVAIALNSSPRLFVSVLNSLASCMQSWWWPPRVLRSSSKSEVMALAVALASSDSALLLGLVQFLVGKLDLIVKATLQHLVVLQTGRLLGVSAVQLCVGLVRQVVQDTCDASAAVSQMLRLQLHCCRHHRGLNRTATKQCVCCHRWKMVDDAWMTLVDSRWSR